MMVHTKKVLFQHVLLLVLVNLLQSSQNIYNRMIMFRLSSNLQNINVGYGDYTSQTSCQSAEFNHLHEFINQISNYLCEYSIQMQINVPGLTMLSPICAEITHLKIMINLLQLIQIVKKKIQLLLTVELPKEYAHHKNPNLIAKLLIQLKNHQYAFGILQLLLVVKDNTEMQQQLQNEACHTWFARCNQRKLCALLKEQHWNFMFTYQWNLLPQQEDELLIWLPEYQCRDYRAQNNTNCANLLACADFGSTFVSNRTQFIDKGIVLYIQSLQIVIMKVLMKVVDGLKHPVY
ncbi:unnamed protein product [Paramecium pentaurelia]|uniref:Uncharacterized protein n=1 Tax=Paramecium pentaurelia TaxID=43138 RepID=A0A8S1YMC4_9CILI|nr:unnamed protein product [Paramecium pentaurelia]